MHTHALSPGADAPPYVVPDVVRAALVGMALGLNHALAPEQGRTYAFLLRDLRPSDLSAACEHLAATATFWPKPTEIRETALRLARARANAASLLALATPDTEPTYRCLLCLDNPAGWQMPRRCPETPCGRRKPHGPHTFTARCPCWLWRNEPRLDQQRQEALATNRPMPADCRSLDDLRDGRYEWAKPW